MQGLLDAASRALNWGQPTQQGAPPGQIVHVPALRLLQALGKVNPQASLSLLNQDNEASLPPTCFAGQ